MWQNGIFFVGSLATSVLNYLYYPVLGRLLHPSAFGEIQALVSLFLQAGIFLTVLGTLTINLMIHHDETPERNRVILELEKFAFLVSGGLFVLTLVFGHALQRFLHFDDYLPFIVLSLAVSVTVPFTFRSAYLRGKQRFGHAAISAILGAGAKLLLSVLFVVIGWGSTGAMLGIVLAQLVAFAYAAVYARRNGFHESLFKNFIRLPDMRRILPELKYALLILVCSLAITGLYSIDIIVVKHYFDAHTAGLYAGIATVARIVFFLTASITQVLLPSIRPQLSARHNRLTLLKSFVILSGLGGGTVLLFWLWPSFVVGHLMGHTYLPYATLLPRLSLVVFLVSVINLFLSYHLALRRYGTAFIAIIGMTATTALLYTSHETLMAVVNSLFYGSITMLLSLGVWLGVVHLSQGWGKRLWHNS